MKKPTVRASAAPRAVAAVAQVAPAVPTSGETTDVPPAGSLHRVSVRSVSPKGRRRAGQAFGAEPVELSVSDATLELLQGDPLLTVSFVGA